MSEEITKAKGQRTAVVDVSLPPANARGQRSGLPSALPTPGGSRLSIVLPERKYFKIGEVAELVGVEPHVLRYWETQFSQLRPHKARSGHRLYRRREVETLLVIKDLLHIQRFTIAGARQALRQQGTTSLLPSLLPSLVPSPADSVLPQLRATPALSAQASPAAARPSGERVPPLQPTVADDAQDDDELEFHLADPLQRRDEIELDIEARDGDDLDEALSEQLSTQLAGRRVSRVDVIAGSPEFTDSASRVREFTDSASRVRELSPGSSPGGDEFSALRPGGQLSKGASPGGDELLRSSISRSGLRAREPVRALLQEAVRELEAVVFKLKRS